jgi:transposase
VCLRSCSESWNSHSATGTRQNRHRRYVRDTSVVKTFSVNPLVGNERALEKPSNPRRRARSAGGEIPLHDSPRPGRYAKPAAACRCSFSRTPVHHVQLSKLLADSGYQGPKCRRALAEVLPQLAIEIVRRSDRAVGFAVLPRRWIVGRTFGLAQPLPPPGEGLRNITRSAVAFIRLASIRLMLRKLCDPS